MILKLDESKYIKTENPIDISLSLHDGPNPVLAWYCPPIKIEPVMTDQFIGDVNQGGAINFNNITLNPHGNGTHTECVGHISSQKESLNQCLKEFHFYALLISVTPEKIINDRTQDEDLIVTKSSIEKALKSYDSEINQANALIVRTLPNSKQKLIKNYSGTNPTYYAKEAIDLINYYEIDHLLVDLPSVDREEDQGKLIAHHTFWSYPDDPQTHKTISELIYVPDEVENGLYLLNMQITSLENDASPSKIVLYEIHN